VFLFCSCSQSRDLLLVFFALVNNRIGVEEAFYVAFSVSGIDGSLARLV
jgi:hypothetical protein